MSSKYEGHTPEPWVAGKTMRGGWAVFIPPAQYNIFDGSAPGVNAEANANLAADAPTLLRHFYELRAIVREIVRDYEGHRYPPPLIVHAREVLAEAEALDKEC